MVISRAGQSARARHPRKGQVGGEAQFASQPFGRIAAFGAPADVLEASTVCKTHRQLCANLRRGYAHLSGDADWTDDEVRKPSAPIGDSHMSAVNVKQASTAVGRGG